MFATRRDSRRMSHDSVSLRAARNDLHPQATKAVSLASRTEQIRRASERAQRRHQQLMPIVDAHGHLTEETKRRKKNAARRRSKSSRSSQIRSVRSTGSLGAGPWSADLGDLYDNARPLSRGSSRGSIFSAASATRLPTADQMTMRRPSSSAKLPYNAVLSKAPQQMVALGKATVDRSVWLGGIPNAIKMNKALITRSLEKQYGALESLTIREKSSDNSWAFAVFRELQSAFNAAVKGINGIEIEDTYGESYILHVEPVALRDELDESGALAGVWSKTVEKSANGKYLRVLRDKLEAKGGNAHTAFRVFKGFQRKGAHPHDAIVLEEFKTACTNLNLGMQTDEMEALFIDLGGRTDAGGITLSQLYQLVMGSDKDLQTLVWEADAPPPKGVPQYERRAVSEAKGGMEHGETAAAQRTVWVGNISRKVTSRPFERDIQRSFDKQFGAVEFAEFRIKQGSDRSWGFVVFKDPLSARNATAQANISVDVQGMRHTVAVKPASVNREVGETGAFANMWTQAVEHTTHGKHLKALRAKLEARGGNAHSAFRAFKSIDANVDEASTGYISRDEFREGCRILNLGMSSDDVDALFQDIGGMTGKGLTTRDLYTIVMGSDKDLTRENFGHTGR